MTVNSEKITYLYDANDSRMYKNVDTTLEEYYLKDLGVLNMKTGNWSYYLSGTERHLRIVPDNAHQPRLNATEPTIEFKNSEFSFYETDHLGNTRVVFNPFKGDTIYAIEFAADYYPYGKILRRYVNTPEKYQLTGKQRDEETELDYFGARFFDSDIARFEAIDPLAHKFPAWSTYSFCFDNPVHFVDPDGRAPLGDYYDLTGNFLYTDNIDDGRVYEVGEIPAFSSELKGNPKPTIVIKYVGQVESFKINFTGQANPENPKQADGQLDLIQKVSNGKEYTRFSYKAVGGPFGNGAPPNGEYKVDYPRRRTESGYIRNGFGFSFNVTPQFKTNRTDLRIHPDGNKFGTLGCVGLETDINETKTFYGVLNSAIKKNGPIDMTIDINGNPNNQGGGVVPKICE